MAPHRLACGIVLAATVLGLLKAAVAAEIAELGHAEVALCGKPAPPASASVGGFSIIAQGDGPQVAVMKPTRTLLVALRRGEEVSVAVRSRIAGPLTVTASVTVQGGEVEATLGLDAAETRRVISAGEPVQLEISRQQGPEEITLRLGTKARSGEAAVCFSGVRLLAAGQASNVPISPAAIDMARCPAPVLPDLRPAIETALIEWDWRMQDGIGAERRPSTCQAAIQRTLQRGDDLIRDLIENECATASTEAVFRQWQGLRAQWHALSAEKDVAPSRWEDLWRQVHGLRRSIVLKNPLALVGPLLLVKQVPAIFSHQLTQYYGACARPGGGIFVLDAPGRSMRCRPLAAGELPLGSYQHPEVSFAGDRVLFSFCRVDTDPKDRTEHLDRFYHLYEVAADGSGLRQLTDGLFDDFSPRWLPDGKIIFISTRRGGFHRCGRGPCPVYTLALAEADGSHPRPISYHETHEWDPAVLHDGRVVYTRWDYVDRHPVFYEQLWSVRPDGTDARIFYGNNTYNPVGIWEARGVPGSNRVMATAAAHHAMTAGSIILVDVTRGVDGPAPITRLTPDAPFPESETRVLPSWHAPHGVVGRPPVPPEAERWPGHCYRSPYPLSEKYFLAAYSFDALIGEPSPSPPNMFGIYLVDCFGNKELLYRDLNIASLWPTPLRARTTPPVVPSLCEPGERPEGTYFLYNVYDSWPPLPRGPNDAVKRLRIVQVLPKSTPHANDPPVGLANIAPGRQVLGTVPVEPDGSACFRAPAGIPLAFQALDEQGCAVQIMRSASYLQPGETVGCVGCHDHRLKAPSGRSTAAALRRPPSTIQPGPDGSNPLSYPLLVQPVLDKHCVSCHQPGKPEGGVALTGEPKGHYTASYLALAARVRYAYWGAPLQANSEPLTAPGWFGARSSRVMKLLLEGHQKVVLSAEEIERLATWMDTNALFYGTFDPADQARQRRGERIAGPKMQ